MQTRIEPPHKSTIGGMDANIVALLCYAALALLGPIPFLLYIAWLSPLVFFFMEKRSGFIKFHAVQAVLVGAVGMVLRVVFDLILWAVIWSNPFSLLTGGGFLAMVPLLISLAFSALEIACLVFSWQYKWFKLPLLGNLAEKLAVKLGGFGGK